MESMNKLTLLSLVALLITIACYFYLDGLPAGFCDPTMVRVGQDVSLKASRHVLGNPPSFSDSSGKRIRFRCYKFREYVHVSRIDCAVIPFQTGGHSKELPIQCSWQTSGGSNAVRVIRAQCNHINEGFLP